jgi:CRP-like cAMP-binding protein
MGYQVRQIEQPQEYESIIRLRYAVYAAEEGVDIAGMDHQRRTLRDATDAESVIYGVFDGTDAIATMCLTPMSALRPGDPLRDFFSAARFPVAEARQTIIGRLMVRAEHRGSPVCLQLMKATYRHLVGAGYAVGFLESNPRTIPLYESLGCRPYGNALGHPAFGLLAPMALIPDLDHLQHVRSPFRSLTPDSAHQAALSRWFSDTFRAGGRASSVRLMSNEALAASLRPLDGPGSPFHGLPPEELRRLLRHCAVLDIDAGTTILPRGSQGTEMYLVVSGSVALVDPEDEVREGWVLGSGQAFADGQFRWRDPDAGARRARSLGATRLIAISEVAYAAMLKGHPQIAAHLLRSLHP